MRASDEKMYFLVLVIKFAYLFIQGSLKWYSFAFEVLAITPKQKQCPRILTLYTLMIKISVPVLENNFFNQRLALAEGILKD